MAPLTFVIFALKILSYVIIADALLSWVVPDKSRFPRNITSRICDPLYRPIHKLMSPERTGGLDLAPVVLILLIQALISLL